MANDYRFIAEAYAQIYEAGTAAGMANVRRMKIENLKKQLQAADANIQRFSSMTPQQKGMRGYASGLKYNQDKRAQIAAELSKLDPQFAATQTGGTAPAAAKATASTQQPASPMQDASQLLKATTPRAPEFGETEDGITQPGTLTPTAAPQVPSKAAAASLPGAAAQTAQPVAKASAATQQTSAPSRSRGVYQDFVQRRKQLSGRGY